MITKICKRRFEVTTTSLVKIFANEGDKILVKDRGDEHYTIIKVNDTVIFSRWMRKGWIDSHCQ